MREAVEETLLACRVVEARSERVALDVTEAIHALGLLGWVHRCLCRYDRIRRCEMADTVDTNLDSGDVSSTIERVCLNTNMSWVEKGWGEAIQL